MSLPKVWECMTQRPHTRNINSILSLLFPVVFLVLWASTDTHAAVDDIVVMKGGCLPSSHIAEGPIGSDLTKRQSRFFCDSAVVTHFSDNPAHVMIQFIESKSTHARAVAYAGMLVDDGAIMEVKSVYLEIGKPTPVSEGYCKLFFKQKKLSEVACGAKIDEDGRRTVPVVAFKGDQESSQNTTGRNETPPTTEVLGKIEGDFDRIFEYTMFDKTLPDGKHPVWVYYQAGKNIIRVDMPSMDMCVVTPRSDADLGVINSKNFDEIPKRSKNWSFAQEIWKAAFQRYLIVGKPKPC